MKKLKVNPRIIISICIALILILILIYGYIIYKQIKENQYVNNVIEISEKNENPIFSVDKMYLCSSANVVDMSSDKNLQNLDIYQYADISIHINNKNVTETLTNENTVKELYIDNITFETNSEKGDKSLYYTNSLNFGKNADLINTLNTDRIDFNIVNTNAENNNANYSLPTFYADCSNPITLKYLNKDIVKGYNMEQGGSISFDGKLLKKVGITSDDLDCRIKFKINIVNNNDELFTCWMNFNIPIDELLTKGITMRSASTQGTKYDFFCM